MEKLWQSLLADQDQLESPEWHGALLDQRRERIQSGKAKFLSLDELRNLPAA
ncbi:MAG: hypothetical protein ACI9QL_005330 [Candidatus Omnitrophota bacterium]|jgi:hypothetical protein